MLDTLLTRTGSASDNALTGVARVLHRAGVAADALTYSALACGLGAALLFYCDHGWWAYAAVLVSGLLDAVDGRVARMGAGPTPWGGVLDLLCDRVVEAAILLGIAVPHPNWHLPALVLAATWYVNISVFLAVGAASDRVSAKVIDYPPGLLERSELLIFALIVVALPILVPAVAYLYAVLEVVTAAQRFGYGRRMLKPVLS
ncbi:MAG TPA: CDP-alcohol phosphatidyltransferase family protein [Candidatus Margulisiibacteriota bacterium]|nr:CDP-alcohol phosphatidyltransferase family protein [Candidatus Margulisiibacteriota bacterium]